MQTISVYTKYDGWLPRSTLATSSYTFMLYFVILDEKQMRKYFIWINLGPCYDKRNGSEVKKKSRSPIISFTEKIEAHLFVEPEYVKSNR